MTAKLFGWTVAGALGSIPLVKVDGKKPLFKNNGYNCYSGQNDLEVPGLEDALRDGTAPISQGWVRLEYENAANTKYGGAKFSFH